MEQVNLVIEQFKELLENGKIESINSAARAMGINGGRLSAFLNGKYNGDIVKTAKEVGDYISLVKERATVETDEIPFVPTLHNTVLTLKTVRLTHLQNTIGVIVGRAGLGKTKALTKYAEENAGTIYIEANMAYSAKVLMSNLHKELGGNGIGHLHKLLEEVIGKLKDSGRLIIIDQAEYLNIKGLDLLRTIHDKARIGLILAGLPILLQNIKGVDGVHEQIYTRIGACVELKSLSNEDVKLLADKYLPENIESYDELIKASNRNARVLYILSREAKRIAKVRNMNVNELVIKTAKKQLVA